jgi:hypothetical protein
MTAHHNTGRTNQANRQRKLQVGALLVAAGGFIAQMIAGVTDTPTIPPGLVAIVAAAALVAFTSWQSARLVGVAAGVFNLVAFAVVGAVDRLTDTTPLLAVVGAWLMVLRPQLLVCDGDRRNIEDGPRTVVRVVETSEHGTSRSTAMTAHRWARLAGWAGVVFAVGSGVGLCRAPLVLRQRRNLRALQPPRPPRHRRVHHRTRRRDAARAHHTLGPPPGRVGRLRGGVDGARVLPRPRCRPRRTRHRPARPQPRRAAVRTRCSATNGWDDKFPG